MSDSLGAPRPAGDSKWLLSRADELYRRLGPDFAELWTLLRDRGLLDLESRPGKAPGGFCARLGSFGVPFVYANFNGSVGDVEVLTHECGHAFQSWRSMAVLPISPQFGPTGDAAEIHSMALELLCHPHAELFFGDDASRFRKWHLEQSLLFLPYGAAIDEFQHELYRQPSLKPDQRAELWQELEHDYLPQHAYVGMPAAEAGRLWQLQRHVYLWPFYYIDYCLAQTCALQFWQRAERDREEAMDAYRKLCERGGSLPFSGLVESAGLNSPFAEGTLGSLAADLERTLFG